MLTTEALGVVRGSYRALILFGSHARGNPRPDSDVDLLQVAATPTASYKVGVWSVSVYTEALLRVLVGSGNLFAHHLITEGRVIAGDPEILARLSKRFVPRSPKDIVGDVRWALPLLDSKMSDASNGSHRLFALARYLLRTYIYAKTQEEEKPTYNLDRAAANVGLNHVVPLLRDGAASDASSAKIKSVLESVLGSEAVNRFGSTEAFVVNMETTSRFAAELGLRLLTKDDVPYESISMLAHFFTEDFE